MRLRAPESRDLGAVHAVIVACELAEEGQVRHTLEDLRSAWAAASAGRHGGLTLADDVRVVEDSGGQIVGYGQIDPPGGSGWVHADFEGQGVGTLLVAWLERRQRERGSAHARQYVAGANRGAERLLRTRGYEVVRSNWRMRRSLDGGREAPALDAPEGISLRTIDPDRDTEQMQAVDERAFAADPDYVAEPLEDFVGEHLRAHDFAAELSFVALARGERFEDAVAGFLLTRRRSEGRVGYIDVLGVDPPHQGRGVGRTLMIGALAAYSAARLEAAELTVSSINSRALRLYEGLGFERQERHDIYERPL